MKNLIILAVCLLTLLSCSKKNNGNNSGTTPVVAGPNTVTLNTGGKTYTESGEPYLSSLKNGTNTVEVITIKEDGKAIIVLSVKQSENSTDKPDFELYVKTREGEGTGIGTYPIEIMSFYNEHFSGGESYENMTTGSITVSQNSSNNCVGTFTIDVSNSNGAKQVTGSFKATSF
jgi:hypothetical protein